MATQKNILVLGSTGGSGLQTVEQALERGWKVTVCDRKIEKLPTKLTANANLTVGRLEVAGRLC
jgi:NAD(P)-dependent dehydrogenase (short-subunit alcohol dehydrogenase family)